MSIYKCKMCGGDLKVTAGMTVAECEYCGTKQTLPRLDDDRRANLYDRANHFHRNNDYDKAMGIYERILNEDTTDSEAYWSLVLCRYGIEYVEDPVTHKRIPTVNRAQYTSIFADEDYKAAIENADAAQKAVYEEEAKAIDEIQKGILAISQKEDPFDVFICYKETDNNDRRTQDSVLANDLYHQLTQEGFKVFFSRITLEDKLGCAYEPYIFAALNSAKVMVVLGTKPEYFNAVWVRNEWSRYLTLIRGGAKKMLIPAYRDMDPYDLPEEFSHLQAQDMSKLGFMQDLIRGIKKIIGADQPKMEPVKEAVVLQQNTGNSNVIALLKRGNMALEDGEWEKADSFFEEVLNQDAECAEAYLGKALAAESCTSLAAYIDILDCTTTSEIVVELSELKDHVHIQEMVSKYEVKNYLSEESLLVLYNYDFEIRTKVITQKHCRQESLSTFDSNRNIARAMSFASNTLKQQLVAARAELEKRQDERIQAACHEEENCRIAKAAEYQKFLHNTDNKVSQLYQKAVDTKEKEYQQIIQQIRNATTIFTLRPIRTELKNKFSGYKDSAEMVVECDKRIEEIRKKEDAEQKSGLKKKRSLTGIALFILVIVLGGAIVITKVIIPSKNYQRAEDYLQAGDYEKAAEAFKSLRNYRDAQECSNEATYLAANELLAVGNYRDAIDLYEQLGNYKSSKSQMIQAWGLITKRETLSAGGSHTVGLRNDGTVIANGDNYYGQCRVAGWADIIAISAGLYTTLGLHSNGTVEAVGSNDYGQCNVYGWTDIVAVSAGFYHSVGLCSDGTVVAVGNNDDGQCDVSDWTDIVAISAGGWHTVGLRSDGTVVAVGNLDHDQCEVSGWNDVVSISAGGVHTVGLCNDGSVIATGNNRYGQCDISSWSRIVDISTDYRTVGLHSDGTVVAVGDNIDGRSAVSEWNDIVAISAGGAHTVGLRSDGTVVAVGDNEEGQCDVSGWTDIKLPG